MISIISRTPGKRFGPVTVEGDEKGKQVMKESGGIRRNP